MNDWIRGFLIALGDDTPTKKQWENLKRELNAILTEEKSQKSLKDRERYLRYCLANGDKFYLGGSPHGDEHSNT